LRNILFPPKNPAEILQSLPKNYSCLRQKRSLNERDIFFSPKNPAKILQSFPKKIAVACAKKDLYERDIFFFCCEIFPSLNLYITSLV
jgi:hypothetical protein